MKASAIPKIPLLEDLLGTDVLLLLFFFFLFFCCWTAKTI